MTFSARCTNASPARLRIIGKKAAVVELLLCRLFAQGVEICDQVLHLELVHQVHQFHDAASA
jgi:hypothetical protein